MAVPNITTVAQAKAFILAIAGVVDAQTRSNAIKLNSEQALQLSKAKTILQQAGEYAQTRDGQYLSITRIPSNGMYTVSWLPIRDAEAGNTNLDALYNQMLAHGSESKEITQDSPEPDALSLDV